MYSVHSGDIVYLSVGIPQTRFSLKLHSEKAKILFPPLDLFDVSNEVGDFISTLEENVLRTLSTVTCASFTYIALYWRLFHQNLVPMRSAE